MNSALLSGLGHAFYGLVMYQKSNPHALSHTPKQLITMAQFAYHHQSISDFLSKLTAHDLQKIEKIINEAQKNLFDFNPAVKSGQVSRTDWILLYSITRIIKPSIVIETGTGIGASTTAIALGLERNKKGQLWSIDIPSKLNIRGDDGIPYNFPSDRLPGWAVPQRIRHRINFILEDVRKYLPYLLKQLKNVDMVLLDDDHTPAHVKWEIEKIWLSLNKDGVLLCDDANYGWVNAMKALRIAPYTNCGLLAGARKLE